MMVGMFAYFVVGETQFGRSFNSSVIWSHIGWHF